MRTKFKKLRVRSSQLFGYILLTIILFSTSAWENTVPIVGSIIFLVGVFLVAIASLGRLWCSLYVGGFKTDILITVGPYSCCRNPLYFFSFIGAIGVGFATETLFFTAIVALAFTLYYPLVIKAEEQGLKNKHGKNFNNYVVTTPRFFPKLSLFNEPDTYTVNPKVFKKDLLQALWFIWAIGLLEIIEELHDLSIIPVIFRVY